MFHIMREINSNNLELAIFKKIENLKIRKSRKGRAKCVPVGFFNFRLIRF